MSIDSTINLAMSGLKYAALGRGSYRAAWSVGEVEHFLYFSVYGSPKELVSADFGFRNPEVEALAVDILKSIGGSLYGLLRHNQRLDCKMRFPFGKFAGWEPRWSLNAAQFSSSALAEKISSDLARYLIPLVKTISTRRDLLNVLLLDEEPIRWLHVNGALRAVEIALMLPDTCRSRKELAAVLSPFAREISISLPKTISFETFCDELNRLCKLTYH
jgi:hypothetical protein